MLGNAFNTPWKIVDPFKFVGESSAPQTPAPGTNPHADEFPPAEINCTDLPPSAVAASNAIANSG
jgi:hypothetical protein